MRDRIFISHSSEDKNIAHAICHALESSGHRCWIAPRDVPHGTDWSSAIIQGIRDSQVLLLVFSEHANHSDFVYREIERASHHQCPILPVRLEDILPAQRLELFIGVSHWLDAIDAPIQEKLDEITRAVSALVHNQPSTTENHGDTTPPPGQQAQPASPQSKPASQASAKKTGRPVWLISLAIPLLLISAGLGWKLYLDSVSSSNGSGEPALPNPTLTKTEPSPPSQLNPVKERPSPNHLNLVRASDGTVSYMDPPGGQELDVSVGNISIDAFRSMNPIVNDHEMETGPEKAKDPFQIGPVKVTGIYGLPDKGSDKGQARVSKPQSGGRASLSQGVQNSGTYAYAAVYPPRPKHNYLELHFTPPPGKIIDAVGLGWIGRNDRPGDSTLTAEVDFANGKSMNSTPLVIDGDGNGDPNVKDVFIGFKQEGQSGGIVKLQVIAEQNALGYHFFQCWDDIGVVLKPKP